MALVQLYISTLWTHLAVHHISQIKLTASVGLMQFCTFVELIMRDFGHSNYDHF